MRDKAVISVLGVLATALLSTFFLWNLFLDPGSMGQLGLLGIFAAAMLSHLTVVAKDMFIPLYLPLASVYPALVLGAAAGCGAALGEVATYFLGWGIAETVGNGRHQNSKLTHWIRRYGLWAVLLVAATPLPDTPIVLLAGSKRLSLGKLFIAECVGKTALYSLGAAVGGVVFMGLTGALGGLTASALMVAASILFCVLVTWGRSRDLLFGWFERLIL